MLGLSAPESLVRAVKNSCNNEIGTYKQGVQEFLDALKQNEDMVDEEKDKYIIAARKDYINAVCDSMFSSFRISSPNIDERLRLAISSPQITGLPDEFSIEYMDDYGISAGAVFAFCYYAVTNKKVTTKKTIRTMSMLNHYQNELMNSVLAEFDNQ